MLVTLSYDREAAVQYALRWAFGRNPLFANFTGIGGDCTNFVSQCVYAGGCVMNYTPTFGWYYISVNDRAPAWTGVEYFYNFMTGNDDVGPFASETTAGGLLPGDVIQLGNDMGDFYHTLIVTGFSADGYLISAHSDDARNRPLNTYTYANIRFLHIEGVRTRVAEDVYDTYLRRPDCFRYLLSGGGETIAPESPPTGQRRPPML
ncbi:MAG: amidase domain-containing protein [Clostridia bacterium]|nr:amidase domain-containing protein [Clostridia bacterium]